MRRKPDYARIAELEREIYGHEFEHARPEVRPQLRRWAAVMLAARWVLLAECALLWTAGFPLLLRDWTFIFAELLVTAGAAFWWFVSRTLCGTRGNRPASAYRTPVPAVPVRRRPTPARDYCKVCREQQYRDWGEQYRDWG